MLIRLLLIGVLAAGAGLAQRGGGGGGGDPTSMGDASGGGGGGSRGGGGGGGGMMPGRGSMAPLDMMANRCNLSKDQKKQFSTILDAAHKSAAAVALRKQIPASREQIAAAVLAGKSPEEVKKVVDASGLAMAQMSQIELKTFGELYNLLDADQKKAGSQVVYNALAGMFLKKNWNE
jgi:Spy/CpxP family protein refolding chaperone